MHVAEGGIGFLFSALQRPLNGASAKNSLFLASTL